MKIEKELKFLVNKDFDWSELVTAVYDIQQGYLHSQCNYSIRVRMQDDKGFITIKSKVNAEQINVSKEYEYEIPAQEAKDLLNLCPTIIRKIRSIVYADGLKWEIDEYLGDNAGLVLAELEYEDENFRMMLPDWVGLEVTGNPRYCNYYLAKYPYNTWGNK